MLLLPRKKRYSPQKGDPLSTKHPLYQTYCKLKLRCYDPNYEHYKNYGGRGITVCDRWLESFWDFVKDMGDRPEGTSIDRIDNNGNYEPSNCRWATESQQAKNTSRTVLITVDGLTMCAIDWAELLNIPHPTITWRKRKGWTDEEVIYGRNRKSNPTSAKGEEE